MDAVGRGVPPPEPTPTPSLSPFETLTAKRKRAIDELLEKAAPFFAMQSTGAEIIVPCFNAAEEDPDQAKAA